MAEFLTSSLHPFRTQGIDVEEMDLLCERLRISMCCLSTRSTITGSVTGFPVPSRCGTTPRPWPYAEMRHFPQRRGGFRTSAHLRGSFLFRILQRIPLCCSSPDSNVLWYHCDFLVFLGETVGLPPLTPFYLESVFLLCQTLTWVRVHACYSWA